MADDIRIKDLQSTASYMESDDYLPIDSLALGNRKIPFTGLMDSEDDRLPTTDKTPRGAITEHEDDISEIKSSLSALELDSITLSNQTTNSQGMIVTNLNFDGKWVSAYVAGGRYASFRPSGSDKLVIRLVNDNGEAVTNTTVNVTLYHLGTIS